MWGVFVKVRRIIRNKSKFPYFLHYSAVHFMIKPFEDKFPYKACILSVHEGLIPISCITYTLSSTELGSKPYSTNYGGYFCGFFLSHAINMTVGCQ